MHERREAEERLRVAGGGRHLYIVAAVHGARRRPQDRHIGEMKNDMRLDQRDRWAEQVGVTLRLAGVYGQSAERGPDCRTIARRGAERRRDRTRVVSGKSVSVCVVTGGSRFIKKKNK